MAAMPGWLLVIFGVCLAIPLARLVVLVLTAALCLMQPARVRRAASAWQGGKSHRRCDEALLALWSASRLSQEQLSRPVDGLNSFGLLEFDAILGEPGQQVMAPGADEAASGEPGVIGDLGDRRRRREE
jgi:hypothetical protein